MTEENLKQTTVGIIPARYASSRFPGKPLMLLGGKTIIERVWKQAIKAKFLDDVFVATDDKRIESIVLEFGGKCIMTSSQCETGSDRVCEALSFLDPKYRVIVNIQGDEPMVEPEHIDALASILYSDSKADIGCLITPIHCEEEAKNSNICKIVIDRNGYALYFSRSLIPFPRTGLNLESKMYLRALGLYSYTRNFLLQWSKIPSSFLEKTELLEQLRALEAGFKIKTIKVPFAHHGVDTPEDLKDLEEKLLHEENLFNKFG